MQAHAGVPHMRPPSFGATVQQLVSPLLWYSVEPVHCAKKGSGNRRVRIGVPATHHRVHHALLQIRNMKKLPQRIL